MSGTGVVNAAKINPCRHGETDFRQQTYSAIRDCEGIKRILDWHTDAEKWTKAYVSAWDLEWVGYKRHS